MVAVFSRTSAVALWTGGIAALSLVTGIVYIGTPTVIPPLDPFLPDAVRTVAGFTGTLTGFLLLASALGLRSGLRAAWLTTMLLLPAAALQGVIQSSPFSIPLIVLSLGAWPVVYRQRGAFDRRTRLEESQIAAGIALLGALSYGTVGSFALRDQYGGVETLLDAFYFTLVTATTVGYGDAVPETQVARLFSLSVVLLGATSFVFAGGVLLAPLLESRFRQALGRMTTSQLERLEDHVLVLGHGDLTESIIANLEGRVDFLVVTEHADRAARLSDRGVNVLVDNARDAETLERARLSRARAVIAASDSDGDDALAVLTVRRLNAEVFVLAGASNDENADKLRDAGADAVISPTAIGSRLLADAAVERTPIEELADAD